MLISVNEFAQQLKTFSSYLKTPFRPSDKLFAGVFGVRQSWELHAGVASPLGAAGVLLSTSFESSGSAVIVTAILVAIFQILKCIYGLGSDSCW